MHVLVYAGTGKVGGEGREGTWRQRGKARGKQRERKWKFCVVGGKQEMWGGWGGGAEPARWGEAM